MNRRPKPDTMGVIPWEVADELSEKFGRKATKAEIANALFKRHPAYSRSSYHQQVGRWSRDFEERHAPTRDGPDVGERIALALETIASVLKLQLVARDERQKLAEASVYPWRDRERSPARPVAPAG